jgi:iron(III) transport system ATP-binding protein
MREHMPSSIEIAQDRIAYIEVKNLRKAYDQILVLEDVSFSVNEGEFICFLGPSGCGKTTLLLCLAGLENADSGNILKRGESLVGKPPSKRDVGIVFQSYALFPNLTVSENIRFGLENKKIPVTEIARISAELVSLLTLEGHEHKFPSQLSGGQQQRVALARALAVSPSLLLLDEPLSALDAQVRTRLRGELRDLQLRLGITTIMVTHDQEEAQSLADRIVLMNRGKIEQIGTPWQIYNEPASSFVADFIGVSNLFKARYLGATRFMAEGFELRGESQDLTVGQPVILLIRPENISVTLEHSPDSFSQGVLQKVEFLGPLVRLHLELAQGAKVVADVAQKAFNLNATPPGSQLWLKVVSTDVKILGA